MVSPAPLAVLLSLLSSSASPPPASPPLQVAVLDLTPSTAADESVAGAATGAVVQALSALPQLPKGTRVLGSTELKAILSQQAMAQLAGCDSDRCTMDLAKTITADRVVAGRVGVVGGQALLFLSLIDPAQGIVLARSSRVIPLQAKDLASSAAAAVGALVAPKAQEEIRLLALGLIDPEAARATGDAPLQDVTLAVLFDELGEDGQALRMRAVETCAAKHLVDAGATVVTPAVAQRIKGLAAPRTLLDGQVPEALGSDEVDALLVGVVEYRPGAGFAGTTSAEADLSMQLITVDTGDIVASEQQSARHPGHTFNAAQKAAAGRLCAQIRPLIETALKKRSARGVRIVVTAEGASSDEADALAIALAKGARVARAKVRSVSAKGATLQVTLSGGDGVAFALELPRIKPGHTVVSASAGQVTIRKAAAP
jgi:hypothetical protein